MEEKTKKLLQWHTAFYAGIQIELEPESENLIFENEHMLSRGYQLEKKQKGIITSMERSLQSSFWCVPGCRRKKTSG